MSYRFEIRYKTMVICFFSGELHEAAIAAVV
jgi:hypothetical protein